MQHLIEKICADDRKTVDECKKIKDFIPFHKHTRRNSGSPFRQPLVHVGQPLLSRQTEFIKTDWLFKASKENRYCMCLVVRRIPTVPVSFLTF